MFIERVLRSALKHIHLGRRLAHNLQPSVATERRRFEDLVKTRKSKDCVIYGGGPSINTIDTSGMADLDAFFVNYVIHHKCSSLHSNSYIVAPGARVHGASLESEKETRILRRFHELAKGRPIVTLFNDREGYEINFPDIDNVYYLRPNLESHNDSSLHPSSALGCFSSTNCLNFALQVAFIFGYKNVYLSGFDGNMIKTQVMNANYEYGAATDEYLQELNSTPIIVSECVIAWGKAYQEAKVIDKMYRDQDRKIMNLCKTSFFDMFNFPD